MNKSCWRQALAASTASSNTKFTQAYQNVDNQLKNQLIDLIHTLHEEQVFMAKLDPQSLGEIIWNNVNQMFTDFISDEEMSLETLENALERQTTALMLLALPVPDVVPFGAPYKQKGHPIGVAFFLLLAGEYLLTPPIPIPPVIVDQIRIATYSKRG